MKRRKNLADKLFYMIATLSRSIIGTIGAFSFLQESVQMRKRHIATVTTNLLAELTGDVGIFTFAHSITDEELNHPVS